DGDTMFLWMGTDVSEESWQALFGVSNAHQLKPVPRRLPELPNSFSIRVREVISHLEQQTGTMRRLIIVRQNLDALEIDFANMLMEDTNNDGMSYLDSVIKICAMCTGLYRIRSTMATRQLPLEAPRQRRFLGDPFARLA
ncbi:COPII coat Sec23p-Sfb3p heterodimer component, partial [Serendipita sp. 399]